MRPEIALIYAVFDDTAESLCPFCTSSYQSGCSTVAVHPRSSLGIRDEAADVGEEVHQAGVGRATEDLAELLVSDDNDRAGLLAASSARARKNAS